MSDPPRLLDGSGDDFERSLLCSARSDVGTRAAYRRTLTALGVGGIVSLPLTVTTVASAAASASGVSKIGVALVAKWLALGATVGFATAGGLELAQSPSSTHTEPRVALSSTTKAPARSAPAALSSSPAPPSALPDAGATSPSIGDVPALRAPSAARIRSSSAPAPEPASQPVPPLPLVASAGSAVESPREHATYPQPKRPEELLRAARPRGENALDTRREGKNPRPSRRASESLLQQEVHALDEARQALERGSPERALQLLEAYRIQFRVGSLKPEAAVLEVRALLRAGNRRRARLLGERVILSAPASQHAKIVRSLLGLDHNP